MVRIGIAIAAAALVVSGASAKDGAVSEAQVRCFVAGTCKAPKEKVFSLAKINTRAAKKGAKAPRYAAATRAPVAAGSARPDALDMRLTFALGSDQLTPAGRAQADVFAKVLREGGARDFAIEGHTDTIGTPEQNRALSQRRADSVVAYLVAHGVSADRLQATGYGFDRPRAGTRASDPSNRRVEIVRK